ncbi:hypothetical protein FXO37_02023 [Capsicum annuum]|nr:hypothetical protein FXO37_02023 [Capsicum annuum]
MTEEFNAERSRGSSNNFRTLQITPLDEEDQEEAQIDNSGDVDSYDDEEEEEEDEDKEPVGLGVLEKPEYSWSLQRELFPSKAGGTPAWLDPVNLPTGRSCLCDFCIKPLQFMLQWSMKWVEDHGVSGSIPRKEKTLGDSKPWFIVLPIPVMVRGSSCVVRALLHVVHALLRSPQVRCDETTPNLGSIRLKAGLDNSLVQQRVAHEDPEQVSDPVCFRQGRGNCPILSLSGGSGDGRLLARTPGNKSRT